MRKLLFFSLAFLCVSHARLLYPQDTDPGKEFALAYSLFSQGDFSQAEEIFRKAVETKAPLEDYSLYFLGTIAFHRGALEESRRYLSQLKRGFPQSVWSNRADLQLAKISLANRDYPRALAELGALTAAKPKKEVQEEALYLTGQAQELLRDRMQAYSAYQELRRASPLSSWAASARKEVRRLRGQAPELFALTRVEPLLQEGELLLREREYQEAERLYRRLLALVPKGPLRPRFLMGLANVLRAARKREEAAVPLAEIASGYPGSAEAPAALYALAESYWNRDEDAKALDYFKRLLERYPKSAFADLAQMAVARIHESLGKPAEALRLYQSLSKLFPASRLREEAQWSAAWIHYLQADYERAAIAFGSLAAEKGEGRYKLAALYWQARSRQKMGRLEEAKQLFLQILAAEEESYYKGPAAQWLEKMGAPVGEPKTVAAKPLPEPPSSLGAERQFHLSRARELARLSLHQLATAELDAVNNGNQDEAAWKILLMREYARNGAYLRSVPMANAIPYSSEELARYRYPLAYWETIQKLAGERKVDPYLVVALIRQESLFDPRALSPAPAFGLMQLLPSTAARAATQLGLPQRQDLFEAHLNLTLGTYHLKELLQRYSNNPVKAIAAYNAGESAVARWERQTSAGDEDEFIERIPYRETRLYVKLVLRNYRVYRKIYDNQK